jgi:hypothetical protein
MPPIIGIDPGLDGGIAYIHGQVIFTHAMPTIGTGHRALNLPEIMEIFLDATVFCKREDLLVVIERQQSMPKQGIASTFTIGQNYGVLLGLVHGLGFSYSVVQPKQWQSWIFKGLDRKLDTKSLSLQYCQRRWPSKDWRRTERCTKAHDGITDAACIACYGETLR